MSERMRKEIIVGPGQEFVVKAAGDPLAQVLDAIVAEGHLDVRIQRWDGWADPAQMWSCTTDMSATTWHGGSTERSAVLRGAVLMATEIRNALVAIRKTEVARRFTRTGSTRHVECWKAETVDGEWEFWREDSPGTPWLVYHNPSHRDGSWHEPVMTCGSLRACRLAVTRGWAATNLARCKSEKEVASHGR